MRVRFSEARLDDLIAEDVPYIDLTTEVLGVAEHRGQIEYFTREPGILCGTEEASRIFDKLGANVISAKPSGSELQPGDVFLVAEGEAGALHAGWKVCLNIFDHCSAVATKTRSMVDAAKAANPDCEILTTRKSMPGCKDLLTKAVTVGGAFPHRLGLSETVLVFDQHIEFMGGFDQFLQALPQIRHRCIEKKLFVEADAQHAVLLAKAGVDGIQLDKATPEEAARLVGELRSIDPHLTIIAAGGINPKNVASYAASGVDGIATTSPFTAKPMDMSVRMAAL